MDGEQEPEYVDEPHFQLDSLEVPAPDGADFTDEHVQWALAAQFPDHITGIDYSQAEQQQAQYGGESIA
ncbi:hypothetical protein F0L68_30485 [Solihabitans fulvus]|uniref:Uncharacterized protein n=1 Tax=Solihabitans fulvus TaxID=1892852 RepID=A0A5B2WVN7_9PSEU|nr:hypothetical protein [Solihabitans fulvus]KAA2254509.1 hypothetical protein F0L68_30485 [Solihabitans fulvus]